MLDREGVPQGVTLADAFCREARGRVAASFRALYGKHDPALYRLAQQVLRGEHSWLEQGIVGLMPHVPPPAAGAATRPPGAESVRREGVAVGD
jgi:hypothetical protein